MPTWELRPTWALLWVRWTACLLLKLVFLMLMMALPPVQKRFLHLLLCWQVKLLASQAVPAALWNPPFQPGPFSKRVLLPAQHALPLSAVPSWPQVPPVVDIVPVGQCPYCFLLALTPLLTTSQMALSLLEVQFWTLSWT